MKAPGDRAQGKTWSVTQRVMWHVKRSPFKHVIKAARGIKAGADLSDRRALVDQLPGGPEIDAAVRALEAHGFARLDSLVEPGAVEGLLAAAEETSEKGEPGGLSVFGAQKTLWTHVVDRAMRDGQLNADSAFAQFAMQPALVAVVARSLGLVPRLDYVTVTHSLPMKGAPAMSQLWHRDHDDTRVIKLFVYLTEVGSPDDGPFTFLPAEYSDQVGFQLRSHLPDASLARHFDLDRAALRLQAPRFSVFMVETSRCLHMGSRVAPGHERLMYTATYFAPPRLFPQRAIPFFRLSGQENAVQRSLLAP